MRFVFAYLPEGHRRGVVIREANRIAMRFYFDLTDGSTLLRDAHGVEACDLDEALRQARMAIEELHDTGDLGDDSSGWQLIIRDAAGAIHRTMSIGSRPDDPEQ